MPGLDHVNIQTEKLAETVAFFRDVIGLTPGDPPPQLDPRLVQWMFDENGKPIFHLSSPASMPGMVKVNKGEDTGAVHHVALDCTGHDAMLDKLKRLGLEHQTNHVAVIDLKQIFVHDPNGVLIELNYRKGQH